jgi:hypothetical protein
MTGPLSQRGILACVSIEWLRQHGVPVYEAGDGSDVGQRIQRWQDRRARYGEVDVVPPGIAIPLIERIIDPGSFGLVRISDRLWGALDVDRVRLLAVQSLRGTAFELRYGVSLPFVPHQLVPTVRFHRTLKSAWFDLWSSSQDGVGHSDDGVGTIGTSLGVEAAEEDARTVWAHTRPLAERFWNDCANLVGIFDLAADQHTLEESNQRVRHVPQPAVVAALAAARLGLAQESDRYRSAANVEPEEAAALATLIAASLRPSG